jgi:hypothetical protein
MLGVHSLYHKQHVMLFIFTFFSLKTNPDVIKMMLHQEHDEKPKILQPI